MLKQAPLNIFGIISSSLLVAGTCIGGGMLALPLSIGYFGFFPSIIMMLLCCTFMSITALLYLEATLWMKEGAHMNTLSSNLLNQFWRILCFFIYLFICYASIIAYLSAGGKEIIHALKNEITTEYSGNIEIYLFSILFGSTLILGNKTLGRVNSILFTGMILSFFLLIASGTTDINIEHIERTNWSRRLFFTAPLMLTTFSFPGIVPSITNKLKKDAKSIRFSILIGTGVTFFFYLTWLFLVFGSVSYEGSFGLKQAFICDIPVTHCLYNIVNNPLASTAAQFFSFFAITTSFLGISLSLFDFFSDIFKIKENFFKNTLLTFLILIPSIILTIRFDHVFLVALEISGGIGDAFLSGMIPVLMVWKGRYNLNHTGGYTLFGGKPLLISIFLIALAVFIAEVILLVRENPTVALADAIVDSVSLEPPSNQLSP